MLSSSVSDTIEIQKFDLSSMKSDSTICIIGKRRSGKSELVKAIMKQFSHIPYGVVFSKTERASPFFSKFIPNTYIYDSYDEDIMKKVLNRQADRVEEESKKPENNMFIIMDDMMASASEWKNASTLSEIMLNGRHRNIFFIITLQYVKGIPPALRSNMDYVFIYKETQKTTRKLIYENFGGNIPNINAFAVLMDNLTNDHACMVINNVSESNDPSESVSYYRVDIKQNDEPFYVGSESYWKCHKQQEELKHLAKIIQEKKDDEPDIASEITYAEKILNQYNTKNKPIRLIIHGGM